MPVRTTPSKKVSGASPTIVARKGKNGSMSVKMAQYKPPEVDVFETKGGIAAFGTNNRYPQHTIEQFENSPTHGAIVRFTGKMVAGLGFVFKDGQQDLDQFKKTIGSERSIDRLGKSWALDMKLHNGYAIQVIWAKDGQTVSKLGYVDFATVRKQVDDEGKLIDYQICADWDSSKKANAKGVISLPKFDPSKVVQTTTNDQGVEVPVTKDGTSIPVLEQPHQLYYYEGQSPGKHQYPKPEHIAADTDIQIDIEFKKFHINNILNGLLPSFVLEFLGAEPEEADKADFKREMTKTFAGTNGKKGMVIWNDGEEGIKLHTLDVKNNESRYLKIHEHVITQIISAHMLSSPTLAGLATSSTMGSDGLTIQNAFILYVATVVADLQDQLIEGIQHIFDQAGMSIEVGITQAMPFGDTTETIENTGE